jgi:hypothetical protein
MKKHTLNNIERIKPVQSNACQLGKFITKFNHKIATIRKIFIISKLESTIISTKHQSPDLVIHGNQSGYRCCGRTEARAWWRCSWRVAGTWGHEDERAGARTHAGGSWERAPRGGERSWLSLPRMRPGGDNGKGPGAPAEVFRVWPGARAKAHTGRFAAHWTRGSNAEEGGSRARLGVRENSRGGAATHGQCTGCTRAARPEEGMVGAEPLERCWSCMLSSLSRASFNQLEAAPLIFSIFSLKRMLHI